MEVHHTYNRCGGTCKCQFKKERKCACKIPYLDLLDECFSLSLIL